MRDAAFRRRKLSLTSLIDVIFLLLLFFMLSSTFSHYSEVELATSGAGAAPAPDTRPIFVRLRADSLRVNAREVDIAGLRGAVTPLMDGEARALVSTGADVTAQRLTDLLLALRAIPRLSVQVLAPS